MPSMRWLIPARSSGPLIIEQVLAGLFEDLDGSVLGPAEKL
jgi:hypothetical protein